MDDRSVTFDEFTLVVATEAEHLKLAEQWTAWDSDHAGRIDPKFWMEGWKRASDHALAIDSILVKDTAGPVFFCKVFQKKVKGELVAEVYVQFRPCAVEEDRLRTIHALRKGTEWLELRLKLNGVKELCFDSHNENLIRFCMKRLGFVHEGNKLSKRLDG